jgi:hypothetical protein
LFFDVEKTQLDIEISFFDIEKSQLDIEISFFDVEKTQLDIEISFFDIEKKQLDIDISFFDIEKRQLDIQKIGRNFRKRQELYLRVCIWNAIGLMVISIEIKRKGGKHSTKQQPTPIFSFAAPGSATGIRFS